METWLVEYRKNFDLNLKVALSIKRIEQFYEKYGACYVSRGGLDSLVVSKLVQMSAYKDRIPNVCLASCEPVENIRFNLQDCEMLKSKKWIKQVIIEKGYPLISKSVAMKISRYRCTKDLKQKDIRLNGYMGRNGKLVTAGMIPKKYQSLVYAPFEFSEKCCDITKKAPLKIYERQTGRYAITGERIEESWDRRSTYMKKGCIHDDSRPKCTPIATWTEQDKLAFLFAESIPSIYGKIKVNKEGFYLTGEQRTGCEVCGFGIFHNIERLFSLRKRKHAMFNYMMRGGEWVEGTEKRWIRFRPNGMLIYSNKKWIPNDYGFGYMLPINYIFETLNMPYRIVKVNKYDYDIKILK